jgi:prevent-host-death family protein
MAGKRATWSLAEAKTRLSEIIRRAADEGPQTVTRYGRKAAVIVAPKAWAQRGKRKASVADFFARSPLRGSGIKIERAKDRPRNIDL